MKQTSTVTFDRERLYGNLIDLAFHLDAVVELIAAAGALFDEDRYELPPGGHYVLDVIAQDANVALRAFEDMRVQITGMDPAKVDVDSVATNKSVLPA